MGRHRKKNKGGAKADQLEDNCGAGDDIIAADHPICRVAISPVFGRYLESKKNLKPGDLVIEEGPLVVGPCQDSGALCLGCYAQIPSLENTYRCESCQWPMCGPACVGRGRTNGHDEAECSALASAESSAPSMPAQVCFYDAVVPLRCLLLRDSDPWKWSHLNEMESHDELRKNIPSIWMKNQQYVVDRIRKDWNMSQYSEDLIHTICGYLEVNCFSVGVVEGRVRGLFPSAFLCAHDCTPNTSHIDSSDYTLRIWATVPVPAGSSLTLSYTSTLLGTARRRAHLLESKFFECSCQRCSDPTELGTELSTLHCQSCSGWMRQSKPLVKDSPWICNLCDSQLPATSANQLSDRSLAEAEKLSLVSELEKFILLRSSILHPNHFALLAAKLSLTQLYGKADGVRIDQMGPAQLERKLDVCKEIMPVLDIVEPGYSRIRAVTFYEAHAPLMMLTTLLAQAGALKQNEMVKRLRQVVQYLKEACTILECENADSAEGQTYLAAKEALANTKAWEPLIGKI